MPTTRAAVPTHKQKAEATPKKNATTTVSTTKGEALSSAENERNKFVRLHITPLNPDLLKVYLAPSVLPLAKNISYHSVATFPEKGYGYVELPDMEAQKLKKKLNGSTLKGSKVRIENAKPEKRKVREEADAAKENEEEDRPAKRAKKEKKKKKNELGVLEGIELPEDRKVKRGWTEPPVKNKKEKKEKKEKEKDKKSKQKESKYTKEPEMLFKAKLTPVAATEVARKDKSKDKKKDKKKSTSKKEVVVHEFEKNTKTPSFIKATKVSTEKKPPVEYVDGKGWVDEDGNVVEAETGKARNRRVLELVDQPVQSKEKSLSASPSPKPESPKSAKKAMKKTKKVTPPPSSSGSESESEESSVVSSSSEDESSEEEEEDSDAESSTSAPEKANKTTPEPSSIPASTETKEVHPLEALYKRPKPGSGPPSTPAKALAPIKTSFSFFDNNDSMEVDTAEGADNQPITPYTQRDLEWRGLRSAAPTPDTAAIGRRFSFPWRTGSQEADEDEEPGDAEAEKQLTSNTKANSQLPDLAEEDEGEEEDAEAAGSNESGDGDEKPESEFRKWFWENQGNLNRSWKKRRRDALKAKRLSENRKITSARRG